MPLTPEFACMNEMLTSRAKSQPDKPAYVFISEKGEEKHVLSFGALHTKARRLAVTLRSSASPGDRCLLIFAPGIDFFIGFFGCLIAGLIPVPVVPPRRSQLRSSTLSIANDCLPAVGIVSDAFMETIADEFTGDKAWDAITWFRTADTGDTAPSVLDEQADLVSSLDLEPTRTAFLQYTSGSTSAPKGVMVSHRNLVSNLEMIRCKLGNSPRSTHVSWVPLYHDMGLILNALQTAYVGSTCVLMPPANFMKRPLSWLTAISRFRAEVAGGPNFGFDLCVSRFKPEQLENVDLSCWKLAVNGAEPVRAETIRRFTETFAPYGFSPEAFTPCYGMAEATLLISGGSRGSTPHFEPISRKALASGRAVPVCAGGEDSYEIVSCGRQLKDERVVIVHPDTRCMCKEGCVGEIWVHGDNVADGYWQNEDATIDVFRARLAGTQEGSFLRTGDLGLILNGEIYITGRLKDVIIVRGENHYPQDIEATVQACHPAFRDNFSAAFMTGNGPDAKLIVVQEIRRDWRQALDVPSILETVRSAVIAEHELRVVDLKLIPAGTLPKTSSGKVRRTFIRDLYEKGEIEVWWPGRRTRKVAIPV